MSAEHIIEMDHHKKNSEMNGYFILRWMDRNLTWNPSDWGDIDMIYVLPDKVWLPDLMITNQTNWETVNFTQIKSSYQLIRVWANKAFSSDLQD